MHTNIKNANLHRTSYALPINLIFYLLHEKLRLLRNVIACYWELNK